MRIRVFSRASAGSVRRTSIRYGVRFPAAITAASATLLLAGCATQTVSQPPGLWQPSGVTTGSIGPAGSQFSDVQSSSAAETIGWGSYSGARGQPGPQPQTHYLYRGGAGRVTVSMSD